MASASDQNPGEQPWRPLHIFNLYRLTIAGAIALIFFLAKPGTITFGQSSSKLFAFTIACWLIASLASGFASRLRREHFRWQVTGIILLDIIFITLLIYASGGAESGLGTLMLVTIAASGILSSGRMTFAFAAIATLSLLFMHSYAILIGLEPSISGYTRIGLLGAGLFAVALLTHILALRVRESEALAQQRGKDLFNMAQINELIIQQMDIGIIVISEDRKILMLNDSARHMLGIHGDFKKKTLTTISPTLANYFNEWSKTSNNNFTVFRNTMSGTTLLPRFSRIGMKPSITTAIFLEDTVQLAHQAQQVKLASLGRLTASIAHEIRNPLSAIKHAGQLLSESDHRPEQDLRLTEIINTQSERLNTIVENILSLSRKKSFTPEIINIQDWLNEFIRKSSEELQFPDSDISLEATHCNASIQFDPTHLSQILCNLCDNALRHSPATIGDDPRVYISCVHHPDANEVEINIIDTGPGITHENLDKLFEPFFTTESSGTGLGLFIARELSELNNAHLNYVHSNDNGAHFRLNFPAVEPT